MNGCCGDRQCLTLVRNVREKAGLSLAKVRWVNGKKIMHLTVEGKEKAKPVWVVTQLFEDKTFAKFGEKMAAHLFTLLAEFCTVCRK